MRPDLPLTSRETVPTTTGMLISSQDHCARCRGLLVADDSLDVHGDTGQVTCQAQRCVQCGEVVDPVILQNRSIAPAQALDQSEIGASRTQSSPARGLRDRSGMTAHTARFLMAAVGTFALTLPFPVFAATQPDKDMVLIPRGEFTMGSHEHSDEPTHQVVVDSYRIDRFEASNQRYKEFMRATGHPAPAYWDDPRLNKPTQPVVGVSWYDAKAFCEWEGKRLPTEAEWERAAKGPNANNHFPWGHTVDLRKANYGQHVGHTEAVDSYPEGVSGFGIYNMAGNVFEWVSDWYDPNYYRTSQALNPQGPDRGYNFAKQGPVKTLRGGSWLAPESSLHTSHRFWNQPENNSYGIGLGFRCAKSVTTLSVETVEEARDNFIHALIKMGAEKYAEASNAIEQALQADPTNAEYLATRELIQKNLQAKPIK